MVYIFIYFIILIISVHLNYEVFYR